MNMVSKYKKQIKTFVLTFIFTLLSVSIIKNGIEIYAVSSMTPSVCVPIIMYHQVKNSGLGKNVISPYEFECDLKYLSENNYHTITMTQLVDYVYNGTSLPENPIILSFDDGYLTTYKYVYPLLQKYNMKIVLSIVGKVTDDFSKVVDNNISYAHMTWEQISEMKASGTIEIQNHSYNMHKVSNGRYGCGQMYHESLTDYKRVISEDVTTLQNKIELMTGDVPNTFTYPFGKYNDNTENILKELGFKATLTVQYGVNVIKPDKPEKLYGLKRICRAHNQSIQKMIKEGMKTIKYVDE